MDKAKFLIRLKPRTSGREVLRMSFSKRREGALRTRQPAVTWCPRSSICVMDLPPCRLFHFCTGMDSHAQTASRAWPRDSVMLAYGQRNWPTASVRGWPMDSVLAYGQRGSPDVGTGQLSGRTAGQRDGQSENNAPQAMWRMPWNGSSGKT